MSRSAPDGPPPADPDPAGEGPTTLPHPAAEWRLLVRLPGRVLTAALADQGDDPGVRVHCAVAGLEAIAAGRLFDSELVRAVATAIYAEAGATAGYAEARPWGRTTDSGGGDRGAVLTACRAVVATLGHVDPADSAAYRQWVQSVAARTAGTGSEFVADLGWALDLTVRR